MNRLLVYQWIRQVSNRFRGLRAPQTKRLARFSLGVMLARHCHHARIAEALAPWLRNVKADSLERQIRKYTADKRFDMAEFFASWAAWVFEWLPKGPVYLLVDETPVRPGYRAMVVGAAFGRRCVQLAWRCYPGRSRRDSPRGGQVTMIAGLLAQIKDAVPQDRQVVVMADRGIGNSPALCRRIAALGWTFLLRIPNNVKIETEEGVVLPIEKAKPGKGWRGSGTVFIKRGQIQGHVLVHWDARCSEPWILITNDPNLRGAEYAIRNWQEQVFRDHKGYGWEMEKTGVSEAERLDRFLALLALAHGVALALGSIAVFKGKARNLIRGKNGKPRAALSMFKEGLNYLHRHIKLQGTIPELRLIPDGRW